MHRHIYSVVSSRITLATSGYPFIDNPPETRKYYGNAIEQNGNLYLDGTKAEIHGDIRLCCAFDIRDYNKISTNYVLTLVGASDDMNDYELTSLANESLDGRVVVVPGSVTYDGTDYSVDDAEPYVSHFKHNHKRIVTNTDYINQVPTGTNHEKEPGSVWKTCCGNHPDGYYHLRRWKWV